MRDKELEPSQAMGERFAAMDHAGLTRSGIALCKLLENREGGVAVYHGGIYPENISQTAGGEWKIGPGRRSDWEGQELQFIAPELYWDGVAEPTGDVYALGLLLYYGVTGGKLPLEGLSPNPQLSRMSGAAVTAPEKAGPALGEIIEKACRFRADERFGDVRQLRIRLESGEENKYLGEHAEVELFSKQEQELSEIERMMLDIISGTETETLPEQKPLADIPEGNVEPVEELSAEEAAPLLFTAPETAEPDPDEAEAARRKLVDEVFGSPEEKTPETTRTVKPDKPEPQANPDEEPEDVRVYEPAREKKDHIPIPILTVEKNPELEPVVPKRSPRQYTADEARNREIERKVRKRRTRPLGVILILCGLLIFVALFVNHYLQNIEFEDEGQGKEVSLPEVSESAISTGESFITAQQLEQEEQEAARQTYYQVFSGDMSWTDSKNAAMELGGMLAVINSQEELNMVTQLAQNSGVQGVWVGCHRENGYLQWETAEPTISMTWAAGEPSYTDPRDGAAEDYVMLWNTGDGWAYIDCRNNPVLADPNIYTGVIGYVCEFVS